MKDLIDAAERLIATVSDDNSRHGGLSSSATIRAADELRLLISCYKAAQDDTNLVLQRVHDWFANMAVNNRDSQLEEAENLDAEIVKLIR